MTEPVGTGVASGTFLRGGVWFAASRSIPYLYALVISVVAARFLGPEGMGRQSFIAFVELSLALLLAQGLALALIRTVGEAIGGGNESLLRGVLAWAWKIEIGAAALGAGVMIVAALAGSEPGNAWVLAGIACAFGVLHSVPSSVLIGAQRWRDASIVGLVTGVGATIAIVVVLAAGGGITGMFAVEAAVAVVNLAWTGRLASRTLKAFSPRTQPTDAATDALRRQVMSFAGYATLSVGLAFLVERRSELFFLDRYSTDTQIALYSIVFSMLVALIQLPTAVASMISPAVAGLVGAGASERIAPGYARALRMILLASIPIVAAGASIGPALLRAVYGDEYAGTRPVLLVMLATLPLVPLAGLASALLAGMGRPRLLLAASALAGVTDVVLAAILVRNHGAVGAALANVTAQVVLASSLFFFARRNVGGVDWDPWALVRTIAAAIPAGAAASAAVFFLGGTLGLALGALLLVGLFGGLSAAVGILPAHDAVWLEQAVGGAGRGRLARACRRIAYRPLLGPT